jgi:hypothetical protein
VVLVLVAPFAVQLLQGEKVNTGSKSGTVCGA